MGQASLPVLRILPEQLIAHQVLENRVPQEFQALIVLFSHGGMGQGPLQQIPVPEPVPERFLQLHHFFMLSMYFTTSPTVFSFMI